MWLSSAHSPSADNGGMTTFRPHPKPTRPPHFVKQWRKHRGLSQEALAERIGKTHSAISQLERGKIDYTQGMLEALADALMCEPADLLMRDPSQDQMIWSLWETLSEVERKQTVRFIKAIHGDDKAA